MSSEAPAAVEPVVPKQHITRFRWKIGLGILVLGIAVQTAVWFALSPDRTYQVFSMMPILSATAFLLVLWWTFVSGLPWRNRFLGLAVLAVAAGSFFGIFRVDGFRGDMIPILALRSDASAEERAAAYLKQQSQLPPAKMSTTNAAGEPLEPLQVNADDWSQFRGPHRDGIVRETEIRHDWEAHPPQQLWRHPIGLGWSSFAVVGDFAFTQEQREDQEAVVCYELSTGRQIWAHTDPARFEEPMGGPGPRATPTIHDTRLYALGATGILNCLDARTGRHLWSTDILQQAGAPNLDWAMAGSPLVYDDVVVVNPGGSDQKAVAAYDRITGEKRWSAGSDAASYTAPVLTEIDNVRQVLIFDGFGVKGHDADSGAELWRHKWSNSPKVNAVMPIVIDNRQVFFGSGYAKGSVLLDVSHSTNLQGDKSPSVTPQDDESQQDTSQGDWKTTEVWQSQRLKLKFNDPLIKDGFIYGLDEGILTCLDLATGKVQWKRGRYGYGQMLLIDEVLLIQAESGEVVLVEASPQKHTELASFPALEGKTWNHPVVIRGQLLVRNGAEAACYDISPVSPNSN